MAVKHLKFLRVGHWAPCNISESNNELQLNAVLSVAPLQ